MLRFFISLLLSAACIAGVVLLADQGGWFSQPSWFIQTLAFLTFSTAVIYVYLFKANKTGFFLQLYLLTMVLKLLAYCGYNLIMILADKRSAVGNVVFFMATYFVFTVLEILFLYSKISRQNTPQNRP